MQCYVQKQGIIQKTTSFELISKIPLEFKKKVVPSQNVFQDFSSNPVFMQESYKETVLFILLLFKLS